MNYGNGQKVSLLPEFEPEPIEVKVDLTHDENGCLDFDSVLRTLERAAQEHWGLHLPLLPGAKQDAGFMNQVKQAIIDDTILVLPDILETFDFYPEGLTGEMIPCHIPVKMKGSGMVASIWGCVGEGGGYDLGGLVNDLEDSYREMLFLPAGYDVFGDSQRNAIRANGTKWIEKLKAEYRNHLADKLGYSKEPEYKYKEIKTYSFPTFSGVVFEGKTIHASFTLSGSIVIRNNKLQMDLMGKTALLGPPAVLVWNGTITLLKNGVPVVRKALPWTSKGVWPGENSGKVPIGEVSFQLDPPDPNDRWQLKFDVGYVYHEHGAVDAVKPRADQIISIEAKWVKFPDAIWKIDREYEWLNPL
ncbi:MAG: hypothetical protein KKC30_12180 [Proteobacteria bacterium]|nr:hypothetical protein [Pseudomonadota bacterium]MBU4384462.1 hypothetical protein [Pseudomonadota bacterium]MBU4603889.1 hypothetical protein [Pseudomonadota bacterium]MCG2766388.1 hypothetical protein [Desulfarculaceae bacterium]